MPSLSAQVFYCMDCVFWCGRCTEPSMQGKKAVGRIALSEACSKFRGKKQSGPVQEAYA
jgi:hypothetical protein